MTKLSMENLVLHKDTVLAYVRKSGNPLYVNSLKNLDDALLVYSEALEKLFMVVKLADSDELQEEILDAKEWAIMTPSQKQMLRIKKGIWKPGTGMSDGFA